MPSHPPGESGGSPPHSPDSHQPLTTILDRAAAGDREAASELLPLVYDQLRASAQKAMSNERAGHTLSATALVHEVYLRLVGQPQPGGPGSVGDPGRRRGPDVGPAFAGRAHFYAAAGRAMRQYLVDHARARLAQKRGGPGEDRAGQAVRRAPMTELRKVADLAMIADPEETLSLDAAVSRLELEDPKAAAVVRMRFYAGLSIEQTASVLGISPATVKRDWQFARAWLFNKLGSR